MMGTRKATNSFRVKQLRVQFEGDSKSYTISSSGVKVIRDFGLVRYEFCIEGRFEYRPEPLQIVFEQPPDKSNFLINEYLKVLLS